MSKYATALSIVVSFVAGGCRTFTSPARVHTLDGQIIWFDYDASRRGALMLPIDAQGKYKYRVLSEPSPDVAIGVVAEFVGKASYQGISGEASAKVTESIAELGKRTQTIMFLREALFRLNEMQTANEISSVEVVRLYTKVIDTALELAKVDQLKEAQLVDPTVARSILSTETQDLRAEFDELLTRKVKPSSVSGLGSESMEDYVELTVRTDPQFEGQSWFGIRARGGEKLRKLVDSMRKVAGDVEERNNTKRTPTTTPR